VNTGSTQNRVAAQCGSDTACLLIDSWGNSRNAVSAIFRKLAQTHSTTELCQLEVCYKLALTSTTSGGRSVGIVRLRTQATELS
jgi:hypothetical protein